MLVSDIDRGQLFQPAARSLTRLTMPISPMKAIPSSCRRRIAPQRASRLDLQAEWRYRIPMKCLHAALLVMGGFAGSPLVAANLPAITIEAQTDVAPVSRRLFGANLRPNMQDTPAVRAFLKETGISLFRYPDSLDQGYSWDWDAGGVMARKGRKMVSPLAKPDNALALAKDIGAQLYFTTAIHGTTPEDAARWVAEMKKRGAGGGYWCLGNEPYFKGAPDYLSREAYSDLVNRFAPAMKKADPQIKIGIAWGGPYIEEQADPGRDTFVLRATRQWVDFLDFHFYTGRWEEKEGINARRIMAGSLLIKDRMAKFREILQREAPQKASQIEIHFWEWNGPPWPRVGGIQTLATALFAADALGEMARCGVQAAIQYNLQEHACGLIPGWEQDDPTSWPTEPWNGRTVRPIAVALQLWAKDMGPMLVKSGVASPGSYPTKDWHTRVNYQGDVPLLAAHATRSRDRRGLQLLVINRNETDPTTVEIAIKGFTPKPQVEVLTLNGPSALSHNDVTNQQPVYHSFPNAPEPIVKINRSTWAGADARFNYSFPAHSVTVLRLEAP
jgi:hypothetical protein